MRLGGGWRAGGPEGWTDLPADLREMEWRDVSTMMAAVARTARRRTDG